MLLISGGGACSPVWADLVSALVPTRRVLALDVPGDAGMSASPTHKPRNPGEVAHWLDEVLSALALEHVVVVGHSYGAWLALTHAIHHPDRLNTSCSWTPPTASRGRHGPTSCTPCVCF
jgi:pimeloyl-ACP methyl ester carboxylesterase